MEIYKYDHTTKEWDEILNSKLKSKEREAAFDNYIKTKGQKVSLQDYFKDGDRNNLSWRCEKSYSYKCFGEAENCFERLAKEEIDWDEGLCYCSTRDRSPEDLIESRTDWDDMKSYADGLYYFIGSLKREIAEGKIVLAQNYHL